MKKRPIVEWVYVILEAGLFLALLTFQCFSIVEGYSIYNYGGPYSPYISAFQVALTAVTFLFAIYVFFYQKGAPKTRHDLFLLYFLFILIADFFFSFSHYPIGGHIGFLCAYVVFFFIRKGKWYEGLIALGGGLVALLIFAFLRKLTPAIGVDCFLGAILLLNVIMMWVRFGKEKRKDLLLVCIALSLLLISDGSIALRTFITSFPANHIIAMITWPTYVAADILLAFWYLNRKKSALSKEE